MRMNFWRLAIISLILSSCAQVGTITGGERDSIAPKPIEERVSPPNASLQFTEKKVRIPFDEFIQLNSPSQNIKMIPPHATIKSKVKGKILELSWEEDLQPNTTYAIYLNRAVKDFTEGNDTIMQYVFSTGQILDTLEMDFFVADAWTGKPSPNVTVGLFDPETDEILNFASTNTQGVALLKYLSPRDYKIRAFLDDNNDLKSQKFESQGYIKAETVNPLDSNENVFRMIPPDFSPQLSEITHQSPGIFFLGANVPLTNVKLSIFNQIHKEFTFLAEDSLQIFLPEDTLSNVEIIIESDEISDTLSKRIFPTQKTGKIDVKLTQAEAFSPKDVFSIKVNSWITEINPTQIQIIKAMDSSELTIDSLTFQANILSIHLDRNQSSQVVIVIDSMAIKTQNGWAPKSRLTATLNPARKYGNLILLENENKDFNRLVFVMKGEEVIYETSIKKGENSAKIDLVKPDSYWFKVVLDTNQDGKWSKGSIKNRIEPETILLFTDESKVRANWDVEVKLEAPELLENE